MSRLLLALAVALVVGAPIAVFVGGMPAQNAALWVLIAVVLFACAVAADQDEERRRG